MEPVNIKLIAERLEAFLTDHPHVEKIYLLADGSYVLNVHEYEGELYSRVDPDVKYAKNPSLLQDKYKVVETITREDVEKTLEQLRSQEEGEAAKTEDLGAAKTEDVVDPETKTPGQPEPEKAPEVKEPAPVEAVADPEVTPLTDQVNHIEQASQP